MKDTLIIGFIVIFCFVVSMVDAVAQQEPVEQNKLTRVGFRTGFNLSRWVGEGATYARVKTGYHAGFFIKKNI
ncbi:MAG: hypothetical protein EOO43_14725, partial [Flavobacterium sp.]